jgi:hypothetical protein
MSDHPAARPEARLTVNRLQALHTDQLYLTLRTLLRCGTAVLIAYFGFEAVKVFAGESTRVDLALSLFISALAEVKMVALLSLTGVACAWGVMERTLRHRKVAQLQTRIRDLETRLDPERSSSGLTSGGRTNPEDRRR